MPIPVESSLTQTAVAPALLLVVVLLALLGARSSSEPPPPRRLGPYTLLEQIGAGGMGVVFRARHASLDRTVALKLFGLGTPAAADRCETEVQSLARLNHPNVVTLHDYGRVEGRAYCAMELLEGADLERVIERQGAQDPRRVVHVLLQACSALEAAHAAGIVHGDIKPANLFLCRSSCGADVLKLLDFGLARRLDSEPWPDQGRIVGTPRNMAPECFGEGEPIGPSADLYSLGTVAYALLAGAPVFGAMSLAELASQHLHALPAPLRCRAPYQLSPVLEGVVMRCLRKLPGERPRSAAALRDELLRCPEASQWRMEQAVSAWRAFDASAAPECGELHDTVVAGSLAPESTRASVERFRASSLRRCG